jgi:hypothetical protein
MDKILVTLLLIPVLLGFTGLGKNAVNLENRSEAAMPDFPTSLSEVGGYFKAIDAFVSDNIGLRNQMLSVKKSLDRKLNGSGNSRVIAGKDGWFFYNASAVIERNLGLEFNEYRVKNITNHVLEAKELSDKVGANFIAIPVPNKHSVYMDKLPSWAQGHQKRNEQRATTEALIEHGVQVSDPYSLFQNYDLDTTPLYFRRDTHWNDFGAYIAFFDAINQLELPNTLPDPKDFLLGYYDGEYYGVLDQFMGLESPAEAEPLPNLNFDFFSKFPERNAREVDDHVSMDTYIVDYDDTKPKLLIIGDSFTYSFFRRYFGSVFGEVRWSHNAHGAYSRTAFEEFQPDYVIFEFVDWETPAWHLHSTLK